MKMFQINSQGWQNHTKKIAAKKKKNYKAIYAIFK